MKTGTYKGDGGYTYTVLEDGNEPLILVKRPDGTMVKAKAGSTAKTAIMKELASKEPDEPLADLEEATPKQMDAAKPPEKGMVEKGMDMARGAKDSITKAVEAKLAEMKGLGRAPDGQSFMALMGDERESMGSMDPKEKQKYINAVKMAFGGHLEIPDAEKEEEEEKPSKPETSVGEGTFRPKVDIDGDGKGDVDVVARSGKR